MQPQYITLKGHAIDITGQRFGRLVALGPVDRNPYGNIIWLCRCDCGATSTPTLASLRSGNTESCGCLQRERTGDSVRTHGMASSRLYEVWCGILKRCCNSNAKAYANYGGRGITVCDEWQHDFEAFHGYVSQLPDYGKKGYQLDRIDNDGNYQPGNVRWLSQKAQSHNTRKNVMLTHDGKTQCVSAWAEELGMEKDALYGRLRRGWSIEKALTYPAHL